MTEESDNVQHFDGDGDDDTYHVPLSRAHLVLTPRNIYSARTQLLIGDGGLDKLARTRVLCVGLGGVGGGVVEALARAGIGFLTLVDPDVFSISNINRQLGALNSTVGCDKTEVMAARVRDINPSCHVIIHKLFVENKNILDLLTYSGSKYDFVVDAIDSVRAKCSLIATAAELGIPVVSCMGAGGKYDPTKVTVGDIFETTTCPLAKIVRRVLRSMNFKRKGAIKAVYSTGILLLFSIIIYQKYH